MAIQRLWVPGTHFTLNSSGNVCPRMSSLDDANDRFPRERVEFKDSGTRIGAFASIPVPTNYVYNVSNPPKAIPVWSSTATSGDAVLDFDYKAIAAGESLDPSTDDEALTVTETTPGTARLRKDSALTIGNTLTVNDLLLVGIYRDGAQAADTLAASVLLEGVFFEFADM